MTSASLRTSAQPVIYSHDLSGYRRGCRCDACRAANTARAVRAKAARVARQIPDDVEHGAACYSGWGCRCDVCRAANAAQADSARTARMERPVPDTVKHGAACYSNWGCRCDVCTAAWAEACRAPAAKYRKVHADEISTRQNVRQRARNDEAREFATRHGYQWTGPELELAARRDLTAAQVAKLTGRTIKAVANMRRKLRDDPKTINLAGLAKRADKGNLNR